MPIEYRNTAVSVSKTQEAIRKLLKENNVIAIRFTDMGNKILLEFNYPIKDNMCFGVRMEITLPDGLPKKKYRKQTERQKERQKEEEKKQIARQYYRALYWILKAKFEAVNFGLVEFGKEFLGNLLYRLPERTASDLLSNNQTAIKILGQSQILMIDGTSGIISNRSRYYDDIP